LPNGIVEPRYGRAEVAEQADASVSKTDVRKDVRVRLPLSAPSWRLYHEGKPDTAGNASSARKRREGWPCLHAVMDSVTPLTARCEAGKR
jgi:hypothetical protein